MTHDVNQNDFEYDGSIATHQPVGQVGCKSGFEVRTLSLYVYITEAEGELRSGIEKICVKRIYISTKEVHTSVSDKVNSQVKW